MCESFSDASFILEFMTRLLPTSLAPKTKPSLPTVHSASALINHAVSNGCRFVDALRCERVDLSFPSVGGHNLASFNLCSYSHQWKVHAASLFFKQTSKIIILAHTVTGFAP